METDPNSSTAVTDPASTDPQAPPDNAPGTKSDPPAGEKTFTQAELNAIVKRETKRVEDAQKEAARIAQMSENEKAAARAEAAEKKAAEAQSAADRRIVKSEAKIALARAGVKPEAADYAINALGDLSDIAVDDNGEPDAVALNAKIDGLLTATPQLLAETGTPRGGAQMNGGAGIPDIEQMSQAEFNKWYRENMNTG